MHHGGSSLFLLNHVEREISLFPERTERKTQFRDGRSIDKITSSAPSFSEPYRVKAEATNGPRWVERLQLSFNHNRFHLMMNMLAESGGTDYVKMRPSFYCAPLY